MFHPLAQLRDALNVSYVFGGMFPLWFYWTFMRKDLERRLEVDMRGDSYRFDQAAWAEALQLRDEVCCYVLFVRSRLNGRLSKRRC